MRKQISRTHSFVDKGGRLSKWAGSMLDKLNDVADLTLSPSVGPVAPTAAAAISHASAGAVISVNDGTTAESSVDATPRKIAAFDTNGPAKNMIANGDDLVAGKVGVYMVVFGGSFIGSNNKHYHMEIYVNSTGSGFKTDRSLSSAGDEGAVAIHAILALKPADAVSVYQYSPDGGTAMTFTQASLLAVRLWD